ncbi:MAG: phospholipid/cholesterol/gamma-HCH transport system substrate-binding protein [Solirubrobacteraceae bacterium]|nr:phospholipid/cholesterol/gamma-HCH transport system substrate-binding protein [Solirubrobacteraceae bacterium]
MPFRARGWILGGVVAVALVALVAVLSAGGGYTVHARFVSASQIVKGNEVKVAGEPVGSVQDVALTDDGQAELTLRIDGDGYAPLRRGTRAIIRVSSLSGVANRYVDLQLGGARGADIPDGGRLATDATEAAVDLDQIFNTFDPTTRAGVSKSVRFLRDFQAGREDEANAALRYLNPALSSSSRLFAELNRDTPDFQRFVDETAKLVTDVSARDDALSGLVRNLATTASALTSHGESLGASIGLLPDVLRRADSTFVDLRASLDDLTPLVDDAKPVVRSKLRPLLAELRPFARDARPAVRDLSATVRRKGADNDLVELLRRQPAIDKIANASAQRNGRQRPGALPATAKALADLAPQLAYLRPYAPELAGWFDDFSTTGAYDALGNFSRAGLAINGFLLDPVNGLLPVPASLRSALLSAGTKTGRNNRCPGALERTAPDNSNPYVPEGFNCDRSQVPIGP